MENAKCRVVETARELVEQLESYRLPDDFKPLRNHRQTIKYIRYQYTSYMELLHKLNEACTNFQDRYGLEYCDEITRGHASCPLLTQAHYILEQVADDQARRLYS